MEFILDTYFGLGYVCRFYLVGFAESQIRGLCRSWAVRCKLNVQSIEAQTPKLLLQSRIPEIFSSDLPEWFAQDDLADRFLDAEGVFRLPLKNLFEDRLVGQLDRSTERVPEEFSVELTDKVFFAMGLQVGT